MPDHKQIKFINADVNLNADDDDDEMSMDADEGLSYNKGTS